MLVCSQVEDRMGSTLDTGSEKRKLWLVTLDDVDGCLQELCFSELIRL